MKTEMSEVESNGKYPRDNWAERLLLNAKSGIKNVRSQLGDMFPKASEFDKCSLLPPQHQ